MAHRTLLAKFLLPLLVALAAGACRSKVSAPAGSARPTPSPVGKVTGAATAATLTGAGGSLVSPDGKLTVTVPPGAIAGSVQLTIDEITNTAPGGVGTAYRLGPAGSVFALPVTLTFNASALLVAVDQLAISTQDGTGFWIRPTAISRDAVARTLTALTAHFSDWALVTATTARDLTGPFTVVSTVGIPYTATGTSTLNYAGDGDSRSYFIQWGSITLSTPVLYGASSCVTSAPTLPLIANVAEVRTSLSRFDWGLSGHWNLTCTAPGGATSSTALDSAFDTVGINLIDCARGYVGTPMLTAYRVQGSYAIDCGARGKVTGSWDFRAGLCGTACTTQPDQACHVGIVDCSSGAPQCVNGAAVTDGTACSDGNACTQTDTCQAGACTGSNPVVCTALDQCHDAGTCDPASGTCSNPAKLDGTACNDGNACTQTDACLAGVCTGTGPTVCPIPDQCHDAGSCDPASGTCSNPAKLDGTACNDGSACTLTDTCQAGVCTGSNPVVCAAPDQCHAAGVCNAATGACSYANQPDGTVCSDGNACTRTDTCQGGACTGGNPVVCAALDQCHDPGTCDPASGACSNPAKLDGTSCNDGNACTLTDTCQGGTCTGSSPVVCAAPDACHVAGVCDVASGTCSYGNQPDGTACTGGACLSGACVRNVTGTRLVTNWPDAGLAVSAVPPDVVTPPLATLLAIAPDGAGGFLTIPGTLLPDGSFTIPNVPVGSYRLVIASGTGAVLVVETAASTVDLGWDALGRASAVAAASPTSVTVTVGGLAAWDPSGDQIQLTSGDADVWDPVIRGPQLAAAPGGSVVEDWGASAAGGPLDLLAAGDTLWIHHLGQKATGGAVPLTYRSAVDATSLGDVSLSSGAAGAIPVDFTASTPIGQTGSFSLAQWDPPSYEAFLAAMAPAPAAGGHALHVGAAAHALAGAAPVPRNGWPDLLLLELPAGSAATGALAAVGYGQFLPAPLWLEWRGVDFTATQGYTAPGATAALVERASVGRREPMDGTAPTFSASLGPVTDVRVGAALASTNPTGVTTAPTLSWTPWAGAGIVAPSSYTVELFWLRAQGVASVGSRIATLRTGSAQIALPSGLLAAGNTYYARITAHADAPDDFATAPLRRANVGTWASALTGTFSP